MAEEELTPARQGALLAAAVQGVAWALIEYETDTSDRGVSDEHYRDAVRRAQELLPTLLPPVVPEEPEQLRERLAAAERSIERVREAARYGSRMDANPTRMAEETVTAEWHWWQSWHLRADAAWRRNILDALEAEQGGE